MTYETLLAALCLVLILESLGPLLFPNRWRNYLKLLSQESPALLQKVGILLFCLGITGLFIIFN